MKSYNNQDIVELAKVESYSPLKEDKSPDINLHIYGQLIFDKGAKVVSMGKDNLFNK